MTKICKKCKKEFPATLEYFFKISEYNNGLRGSCKVCMAKDVAKRRKDKIIAINTDENIKKKCTGCYKQFPATIDYFFSSKMGKYGLRSLCRKCFYAESMKSKCKPESRLKQKEYRKKYNIENRDANRKKCHEYYLANTEKEKARAKEYRKNNTDKYRLLDAKRNSDPKRRASQNISKGIRQCLKYKSKRGLHWETLVDFTKEDFVKHMEKLFADGMNWKNYGEWHIDHKIPISAFNFEVPEHEDFKRCWSLKNLQPLWAGDNISKHAKLKKPFQPSLAL